jgi:O-methyltransferase involved in polyketide biosynthesis
MAMQKRFYKAVFFRTKVGEVPPRGLEVASRAVVGRSYAGNPAQQDGPRGCVLPGAASSARRAEAPGRPEKPHVGTVDFEHESVAAALGRLPFRPDRPAVFAWLGVTMYLTRAAIEGTWRAMRSVASRGSELVFDFIHPEALSETAAPPARRALERVRVVGEPIITGLDPAALGAELEATGWTLIEQLDPTEINQRCFAMRTDGYRARRLGQPGLHRTQLTRW